MALLPWAMRKAFLPFGAFLSSFDLSTTHVDEPLQA
jgi:hypothetical protein